MSKLIVGLFAGLFSVSMAFAQAPAPAKAAPVAAAPVAAGGSCEARAIGKNGKALAGAAKTAFLKKCEADAKGGAVSDSGCAAKAVSKAGKALAGAAKASFIKKCEIDAKGGK